MKFTLLLVSLLLSTIIFVPPPKADSKAQETDKLAEVRKLEAQLKELERNPGTVKVNVSGKAEASANIDVAVVGMKPSTESGQEGQFTTSRKSLNVDLQNIDVPDEYINEKIAFSFSPDRQIGTCAGVRVMQVGATQDYDVVDDYVYDNGTFKITAWKGFRYDRASVPRIFWVIIDKDSLSNVAPLFHDLLYRHGGELPPERVTPYRKFSRLEADNLFRELMGRCGVGAIRREMAYRAVRSFSGFAWKTR